MKDIKGQKFGRLMVIEYLGKSKWKCKCECGNIKNIDGRDLRSGHTKSCGCLHSEIISKITTKRNTKHGKCGTRLYYIWYGMKDRCYNKHDKDYQTYGARGIHVCDVWKDNFEAFYKWSIDTGYRKTLTIDRIDNNKGYSSDNCRWANMKTQQRNRRNNRNITINNETHCLSEWCEILSLDYGTVHARITKLNWPITKALEVSN